MNEGDSAGGGQQGLSPAPPAVPDRRSTIAAVASINSNLSLFQQQQQQQNVSSRTVTSGSAVSLAANTNQNHQHQQHMTHRFLSSSNTGNSGAGSSTHDRVGNLINQQQQRIAIAQIQQPQTNINSSFNTNTSGQTRTVHNINNNNNSSSSTSSNNNNSNLVSNIFASVGTGSVIKTDSNFIQSPITQTLSSTTTSSSSSSTFPLLTSGEAVTSTTSSSIAGQSLAASAATTPDIINSQLSPVSRKRLKLDSSSNQQNSPAVHEINDKNVLKKRILEHKYLRLKSLKEKYSEHVAEFFFLQSGGNMMEYPVWRKKPPTPQFINFSKSYRLDGLVNEDLDQTKSNLHSTLTTLPSSVTPNSNLPQGAEIKIPGVGVTPVAVSTKLPAAVVQLTQQGGTPLVPDLPCGGGSGSSGGGGSSSGSVGHNITDKRRTSSNTSISAVGSAASTVTATVGTSSTISSTYAQNPSGSATNGSQEQFSVKAKQEVYVMQRVSELQREGLWTEKRLPKLQEASRPKAHWDYLLEEMVWLAADFAQERKWKKSAAKKCARMVQKYFQDKSTAAQRAEKAQELQLKRIAGFIAKEVKFFWSNVEKLVEFKHQTKLEEKRKKALDQHLSFIVDQTEKMSQQLAEGMNKTAVDTSAAPSVNSSRISSPKHKNLSDDEFRPENEASSDDEETIAKAEAEAADVNEEVAALQKESQMELDDFLKELPKDYLENRDKIVLSDRESSSGSSADDEEFKANEESTDDEDTIMEQEKNEKNMDYKKELDELNADNEMSLAELIAKYKKEKSADDIVKMELDSDDDEQEEEEEEPEDETMSEDSSTEETEGSDDEELKAASEMDGDSKLGLKSLLAEEEKKTKEEEDDLINDAAAIAESIQPKGNTLSSTDVVTPVPFLLKHTLREYQHIGLDWLVTMHDRKLNGILADEMGLGKTIQTIALLAHLACVNGNWGPHLIIVPSSVMLNWEMEFKKWCPGFKILTYYGSQKERKQKRIGWTKFNAFHVCITSYKLVIQDQQSFRRKKWKYLILDEAQNIKNFKSQRWQLLLNFQTEQRLLLTGTPLQNNLMELWSLMHFLMPHVFQSHREFKEWFSNPMTGMIEGNSEYNDSIIKRLHKVLRPFLLRRLKSEVEKQMPKKYEHVVMCRLSKRQRYLYDDFMSRAKTRETLAAGNLLSVINVLMQLRKVCNHPNLFEVRPTISPFRMEGIRFHTASMVCNILDYDPMRHIDLNALNLVLVQLELCLTAYVSHRIKKLATPRKLIEEIDSVPEPPPKCPAGKYKFHIRIKDSRVQENLVSHSSGVKVGTSPAMKTEGNKLVPVINLDKKQPIRFNQDSHQMSLISSTIPTIQAGSSANSSNSSTSSTSISNTIATNPNLRRRNDQFGGNRVVTTISDTISSSAVNSSPQIAQIVQTSSGRHILLTQAASGTVVTHGGQRLTVVNKSSPMYQQHRYGSAGAGKPVARVAPNVSNTQQNSSTDNQGKSLVVALAQQLKSNSLASGTSKNSKNFVQSEVDPEFYFAEREQMKKERRQYKLQIMAKINQKRCDGTPIYGDDFRTTMKNFIKPSKAIEYSTWHSRSYTNCLNGFFRRGYNWSLSKMIKTFEERTEEMNLLFDNFVIFVPAVSAPQPYLHVSHPHPSKLNKERQHDLVIRQEMSSKLTLLHPITSAMSTQFPDPRLIQYDCGKLQTLDKLLRKLKYEGHRVLIFTQMTKMLDVLEAFLNYHGHIYLRLDGTTRIEQRQILMERFNGDKRIFAFILSTRSGGVGVNLTGADTVIFYDSDWNPTMDAQAQDRCHRIGQTRDVHIYRLVSEKTIEENILKKANQKRLLGDLAIEGGNFTTAYFKSTTIHDLFQVEQEEDVTARLSEVLERDRERKLRLQENLQTSAAASSSSATVVPEEKSTLGAFESALAAAEDEQDVQAAKTAKAEAAADLAEFDENIPLDETSSEKPEMSKADQEVENLVKQLSPIERYAMRFVEETGGAWTAEQLRAAEAEIEQQKREWEANRLAALQKEEEMRKAEEEEADELLTYSREDAKNQIWISDNTMEKMPMWCPPTPPQNDEDDIYIDYSLCFLYEADVMLESQLPPVYVKKEYKRTRSDAGFYVEGRRPSKIRKEDNYYAPRSLFDRPSPAIAKIRRDLKLQRYRGIFKPNVQIPGLKQQMPIKPLVEPEGMAEWCIYEDIAILHVLQNLQGLPLNLMPLSPGHTPNWDLVADFVNQYARTYRSPKQCRYRYEAVIVPREEGKLHESPKKQKKLKNSMKMSSIKGGVKSLRTSQLFTSDNNNSYTKLMKIKFDNIKTAYLKKAPPPKQVFGIPSQKNSKHVAVLTEFGITNYDNPPNPIEIALKKAEKLKEKQRSTMALPPPAQQPPEIQQQVVAQQIPVQQQTAIVVQQQAQVSNAVQQQQTIQQVTQIMQATPIQATRQQSQGATIGVHQQGTQIVKAIVTPSSGMVTAGQVQHLQQAQQVQLQQQSQLQATGGIVTPASVSVVLTTPVSTLSTVQQQTSQGTQIVSIQQQANIPTSTMVSQTQTPTLVQTISTQSMPQVVSVSQLATVGTVLTTSAGLQPNTVATLNTSALRAQRIVAAPGTLQEVVLQQRPNSQSPTIVSMSGLGGVTQTQLRLSMGNAQQVSNVVAKGISVGSLQQPGKPGNQPAQIQLYRQQALRQQLKVLQTSTGQGGGATAVVQTAGGQTALVNAAGTIIQGGIVPAGQTVQVQGQKVSVATVSGTNVAAGSPGVVTSVATVQVAPGQSRPQFIKQVGVGAKQTITRQVTESEMLLVKRQLIGQHKTQVIPQTQIFAPANVQMQQAGTSGQQQIATLVKTSSGVATATGGTVGMTLSQIKPGQIKVTMANQNQVRQLQLQQPIAIAQQRKPAKMTQIAQVAAGKSGVPTQLIVQNPKTLPGSVTVQQIQQVIRHAQPGTLATAGQIVLGKTSVGRVIPVSVSSQPNARQTIQVVSAASAQALAAGNIRAHVGTAQNIAGTIKVAAGATQVQTQQALINALQSQQNQRQNASPVRLQTTSGGSLVAVTVQGTSSNVSASTSTGQDVTGLAQQQHQQQQQAQQTTPQQVRTLVKKKIMSFKSDKEQ